MSADWVAALERLSAVFGPVGALALGAALLAIGALVVVWRALQRREQAQTDELLNLVGANTASHERNAVAHRDSAAALDRLGEAMDRLAETMRTTEERSRHALDVILQLSPARARAVPAPRRRRRAARA